jgi:hypothetical protein
MDATYLTDLIVPKDNEMGGAWRIHEKENKCTNNFGMKVWSNKPFGRLRRGCNDDTVKPVLNGILS